MSPSVTTTPSYGIRKASVKLEPSVVWHSEQWQQNSAIGSAVISYLTEAHRQRPFEFIISVIQRLWCKIQAAARRRGAGGARSADDIASNRGREDNGGQARTECHLIDPRRRTAVCGERRKRHVFLLVTRALPSPLATESQPSTRNAHCRLNPFAWCIGETRRLNRC